MAMPGLGSLGDIGFISVLTRERTKVRTFNNFQRKTADRYATADIHGRKPRQQFLGPGLDSISFIIALDVSLGMNPRVEMEKLVGYSRDGKALPLQIGGKKLGVNKWVIKSLQQTWKNIDAKGDLLRAELAIELEEYV